MSNSAKYTLAILSSLLLLVEPPAAHALQTIEATDGVTVEAVLSIKEPTRIRIDGAAITNVFGNIHSNNCSAEMTAAPGAPPPAPTSASSPGMPPGSPQVNPAGEVILGCDADKGEIYVRPVGATNKPINLFISSQQATYTLLLRRSDTPADTIVIRDKALKQTRADAGSGASVLGRQSQHVRALKNMLVAMASDRVPSDIHVTEVNRPIQLWVEVQFALTRLYEGRGLIGERYTLTNFGAADMVLAEQEFDRESGRVLAVSIENHNLRPGESTTVFVIREGV